MPTKNEPMSSAANSAELDAAWRIFQWKGEVRYFAKREGVATGGRLLSVADLGRAVTNLPHHDFYLHLNPAHGGGIKAATRHITHWRYLMLDLDPHEPEVAPLVALEGLLELTGTYLAGVQTAATVIDSGRGAQAWVALDIAPVTNALLVELSMSGFLHTLSREWRDQFGYRVDTSVSDLARIARCPGTINQRTGRMAQVIHTATGTINPAWMLPYTAAPAEQITKPADCSNLIAVLPHLNATAQEFLCSGIHIGGRHAGAYAAAASLREVGVQLEARLYWVKRGASRCRPRLSMADAVTAVLNDEKKNGGKCF